MSKNTGVGRGNNPASWGHYRSGANHPKWNSGAMIDSNGYRTVRVGKGHPLADSNGYAREHLLVWTSAGGELLPWLEIHHRNGDKRDNRIENLQALSHEAHMITDGRKKLGDDDVRRIRSLYSGGMCLYDLSNYFGVAMQTVSKIIRGESRIKAGGHIEKIDHRARDSSGRFICKKAAGRLLHGQVWNEFPEARK